jgi:hypothetical protein
MVGYVCEDGYVSSLSQEDGASMTFCDEMRQASVARIGRIDVGSTEALASLSARVGVLGRVLAVRAAEIVLTD